VNFPYRLDHPTAACIVFPDRQAASGALAGRDVVLHLSVARSQESFREPALDSPSGVAGRALQDALQAHQVPQPQVAQKKVELQLQADLQDAFRPAPQSTALPVPVMADESV
jgi:hypothetical protein